MCVQSMARGKLIALGTTGAERSAPEVLIAVISSFLLMRPKHSLEYFWKRSCVAHTSHLLYRTMEECSNGALAFMCWSLSWSNAHDYYMPYKG